MTQTQTDKTGQTNQANQANQDLVAYLKAGYPLLYMPTAEESRAELEIERVARECGRDLYVWSLTEGLQNVRTGQRDKTPAAEVALQMIKDKSDNSIFILRDLHVHLKSPVAVRHLRDICRDFKQSKKHAIILSPVNQIPPELERDVVVVDFDLPTESQIREIWDYLFRTNQPLFTNLLETKDMLAPLGLYEEDGKVLITEDEKDRIITAAMGMTSIEAENAFAKAVVVALQRAKVGEAIQISRLVMKEKANAVKKSGILEYFEASEQAGDIGGLDMLKKWLDMRSRAFSKKAREFGLPMPKGILLLGLPGCGKCVKEDSLVVADGSLIRISDIVPSHKDTSKHAEINVMVQSSEKQELATQFHWVGLAKTKRITLSNGMQLEGRYEHPVMVLDKSGSRRFVQMRHLKCGDIVLTRLGADNLAVDTQTPLPYIPPLPPRNKPNGDHLSSGEEPANLPETMTADFAYWLGLLAGDGGWGSPTVINFIQHERNEVIFNKFVELMDKLFGVKPSVHRPTARPHMIIAQSGRRHLRRFLLSLGLLPYKNTLGKSNAKFVPDAVLKGGTEIWQSYIAGLWDTDGHIGNHNELTLKAEPIIRDVAVMLWTMGIPCTISPKKVRKYPHLAYWRINIVGGKLAHGFGDIVAKMHNKRKAERYKPREVSDSNNASRFGDYSNLTKLVIQLWDTAIKSGTKKFVFHKTNRWFSRRTFEKMHKYLVEYNEPLDEYLRWIYEKTIPLPIVKIENDEANVCDIGVPSNSTFVANGILSHNSLSAKAASNVLGVPLIRFDISRVFGGIVGQSEQQMRSALQTIERVGNCLTGDAMITMGDGIEKRLDQLKVGDIVACYDERSGKISRTSIYAMRSQQSRVIEIRTTSGHTLCATKDHRHLTLRDGYPQWVTTDKLSVGDLLAVPLRFPNRVMSTRELLSNGTRVYIRPENRKDPRVPRDARYARRNRVVEPYMPVHAATEVEWGASVAHKISIGAGYYRSTIPTFPSAVNPDLAYLAGLVMSDGYLSRNETSFINSNMTLIRHFERIVAQFGLSAKTRESVADSKYGSYRQLSGITATPLLSRIYQSRCCNKILTRVLMKLQRLVLGLSPELLSYWLSGYIDGDGSIDDNRIIICCQSSEKSKTIRMAIQRLGVVPSKWNGKTIEITGYRARKLAELFHGKVRHPRKAELIGNLKNSQTNNARRDSAFHVCGLLKEKMTKLGLSTTRFKVSSSQVYAALHKSISEDKLVVLNQTIDDPQVSFLLRSDVRWVPVVSLSDGGTRTVYDPSCRGEHTHNYFANGIITHNCVVWIDEAEKALAGAGGSGSHDSGVTKRVFGNFLTFMQEKKGAAFVVMTVNNIDSIRTSSPEMLRKGRFDEIFFVGLPSAQEREEIFRIHINKNGRDPAKFKLGHLVKASEGFSGAEIEQAVIDGMYSAFYEDKELATRHIVAACETTNPLSRSSEDVLKRMKEWAEHNAVNASTNGKTNGHAGRSLQL